MRVERTTLNNGYIRIVLAQFFENFLLRLYSLRLELVVVRVERGNLGLETLAHTDAADEFLELAALLEGSCKERTSVSIQPTPRSQ